MNFLEDIINKLVLEFKVRITTNEANGNVACTMFFDTVTGTAISPTYHEAILKALEALYGRVKNTQNAGGKDREKILKLLDLAFATISQFGGNVSTMVQQPQQQQPVQRQAVPLQDYGIKESLQESVAVDENNPLGNYNPYNGVEADAINCIRRNANKSPMQQPQQQQQQWGQPVPQPQPFYGQPVSQYYDPPQQAVSQQQQYAQPQYSNEQYAPQYAPSPQPVRQQRQQPQQQQRRPAKPSGPPPMTLEEQARIDALPTQVARDAAKAARHIKGALQGINPGISDCDSMPMGMNGGNFNMDLDEMGEYPSDGHYVDDSQGGNVPITQDQFQALSGLI